MKTEKLAETPKLPERAELQGLSQAPRLIGEVSRLIRQRIRSDEISGVMSQHAARMLMANLAVKDKVSQLELAGKVRLSTPTVSILLRKMEEEGLVVRGAYAGDRRVMLVSLTEKGRAFDKNCLQRVCENERRAMQGFSAEEEATLCALLLRVRENLTDK